RIPVWSVPHVLLLATQGVQRKISIKPPPRIRAIMARIVHTVDAEVTRADNSLLAAGKSTTSSVPRPNLLALPSKNLRRRDVFSQDILAGPPILYPIFYGPSLIETFRGGHLLYFPTVNPECSLPPDKDISIPGYMENGWHCEPP
ncbi:uncharacterized protein LOC122530669, partial [Frieseomelitta varia]|uniref:uncharacterized protein LOC122530669 n=1 Tax=Frieseomelitta varia TaxID=561572 RepID=UPI001CB6AB53